MPSFDDEALVDLFRQRPTLALELMGGSLGISLPAHESVAIAESELGEVQPLETRTDLVVLLRQEQRVVFALAIEVQLSPSVEKAYRLPLYAVTLRARHRCPAAVLVVAPDAALAASLRAPLELGPNGVWTPIVLGPDEVPVVATGPAPPELALLSLRAHGDGPQGLAVARAATASIATLEEEGETRLFRDQLQRRFGPLSEALEARVGAADRETLLRWSDRMLTAARAEDVFAEP